MNVFASIPSPHRGVVDIGPIPLRAYGLMLALGIFAAVSVAERRAQRAGLEEGTVRSVATPVVIAGIVGARVYHLFTGYDWHRDGLVGTLQIWKGGLSIWGAVFGGAVALWWVTRASAVDRVVLFDAMAPAVAIGQAIGRWGNWFNQELFGRPTTLPWGLKIDLANRPLEFKSYATFHPTFLYESLWCVAIFVFIEALERRRKLRRGHPCALYVVLYTFERFWMELLRTDKATHVFGIRFNALLSAALCIGGMVAFIGRRRAATIVVERHPSVSNHHVSDEPSV